jgi:hypothetical protein
LMKKITTKQSDMRECILYHLSLCFTTGRITKWDSQKWLHTLLTCMYLSLFLTNPLFFCTFTCDATETTTPSIIKVVWRQHLSAFLAWRRDMLQTRCHLPTRQQQSVQVSCSLFFGSLPTTTVINHLIISTSLLAE